MTVKEQIKAFINLLLIYQIIPENKPEEKGMVILKLKEGRKSDNRAVDVLLEILGTDINKKDYMYKLCEMLRHLEKKGLINIESLNSDMMMIAINYYAIKEYIEE